MSTDLAGGHELARYAVNTTYHTLPLDVRERTKMLIFDQLACTYIGMELPTGQLAERYVEALGGRPQATIVRSSTRTSAPLAAWIGGTAGHAAELDCAHATDDFRGTGHPAAVIVPAAVAIAELQRATGADLINAVALGFDAGARTVSVTGGLATLRADHGLYAGTLHAVGAAFACSRLLGLDARRVLFAAAFSVGQSTSPAAFFTERRHMSKAVTKGGQPAHAGTAAALMAAVGLEACDNIFDDAGGIIDTWGEPGREGELVSGLGSQFAVHGANMKFYAAGYPIHAAVEAALSLIESHRIDTAEISEITVGMPAFPASVVDSRAMPTICMQDMLSVAIVAGRLTFDEAHSDALLNDPHVRRLRELVKVVVDADLEARQPNGRGARVSIGTNAGPPVVLLVEHPRGHRFREIQPTWTDFQDKWQALLSARMGPRAFDEFWSCCRQLDGLDDVGHLVSILAAANRNPKPREVIPPSSAAPEMPGAN